MRVPYIEFLRKKKKSIVIRSIKLFYYFVSFHRPKSRRGHWKLNGQDSPKSATMRLNTTSRTVSHLQVDETFVMNNPYFFCPWLRADDGNRASRHSFEEKQTKMIMGRCDDGWIALLTRGLGFVLMVRALGNWACPSIRASSFFFPILVFLPLSPDAHLWSSTTTTVSDRSVRRKKNEKNKKEKKNWWHTYVLLFGGGSLTHSHTPLDATVVDSLCRSLVRGLPAEEILAVFSFFSFFHLFVSAVLLWWLDGSLDNVLLFHQQHCFDSHFARSIIETHLSQTENGLESKSFIEYIWDVSFWRRTAPYLLVLIYSSGLLFLASLFFIFYFLVTAR